jgi:hypothetical protein
MLSKQLRVIFKNRFNQFLFRQSRSFVCNDVLDSDPAVRKPLFNDEFSAAQSELHVST